MALLLALGLAGAAIAVVWRHGQAVLAHPPAQAADVALVLGTSAWVDGAPDPCLAVRVQAGVALARAGRAPQLLMSGGPDSADGQPEADVMARLAHAGGFAGLVLREGAAQSTQQNLAFAWPLLQAAGARRVVIVSEPFHLWRVGLLARASGFDRAFEVQYAAAPDACRSAWGQARVLLREVAALVHNAGRGHLF